MKAKAKKAKTPVEDKESELEVLPPPKKQTKKGKGPAVVITDPSPGPESEDETQDIPSASNKENAPTGKLKPHSIPRKQHQKSPPDLVSAVEIINSSSAPDNNVHIEDDGTFSSYLFQHIMVSILTFNLIQTQTPQQLHVTTSPISLMPHKIRARTHLLLLQKQTRMSPHVSCLPQCFALHIYLHFLDSCQMSIALTPLSLDSDSSWLLHN